MRDHFLSCQDCTDLLFDYLEGALDSGTSDRLEEHLSACPPCVNFLKTYRNCVDLGALMREQNVHIPMELEDRLKSFLKKELSIE